MQLFFVIGRLAFIAVLAISATVAHAQTTLYWDTSSGTSGLQPGNGTWSTSASDVFWATGTAGTSTTFWTDGSIANFSYVGTGTATISGTVTASALQVGGGGAIGATISGGTLVLTNTAAIQYTAGNGTSGFAINASIILGNGSAQTYTFSSNGFGTNTINGNIGENGRAGITRTGSTPLTLGGTNTYTGVTTISAGSVTFGKRVSLYNSDASSWTASNLVTGSGALAGFFVGGTGEFTDSDIGALAGLGTSTGGFRNGSRIGLDTTNSTGGVFTLSSTIANPNGGANVLGLSKLGTNTLSLTALNTYSGQTVVHSGTLRFDTINDVGGGASSLGAPVTDANGRISMVQNNSSVTLLYVGAGSTTNRNLNGASVGGGGGYVIDSSGSGPLVFTNGIAITGGTTTITGQKTWTLQGSYVGSANEIRGLISGSGAAAITKSGAGTWKLSGTNTYAGITTISAGVLEVTTLANGGVASGIGQTSNAATNLVFNAPSATLRYSGTADVTTNRGFTLSSGAGGGATIESSGVGTLSFDNTVAIAYGTTNQTRLLTLGGANSGANTFAKVLANNGTGTTSFTKAGAGTWILDAVNTYSGTTNVSAGRLQIGPNGSINNSSAISVSAGAAFDYNAATALAIAPSLLGSGSANRATLGGNGTINAAVTLNNLGDTLSPGNSPGIMPFGTSQTWNSFTYVWETNNFVGTSAGTDFDQIVITGSLNLTGGLGAYLLDITSLTAGNAPGSVGGFDDITRTWTILTTTGGITGFDAANWTLSTANFTSSPATTGAWSLSQDGSNLVLSYVTVPEPAAIALAGIGVTAAAFSAARRRRRRSADVNNA
ncbi:MAG: autotransporter-associated beta strand repeat-containing protein [Pirellulales bacterium]